MEILKKITIARMGLGKDELLRACMDAEGPVAVARIFGRAAAPCEHKIGDNGPYTFFKGMFEGVNLLNGQSFRSGALILNGPAESLLDGMVAAAEASKENPEDTAEVPFVYEIGVKYVKDAKGNPYQFTCTTIGEEKLIANDPLKGIREVALGGALPAPTATSKSSKKGEKATA